ncbi:hypothetical protein BU24DRAFT_469808 [Aaosphaeria arxii CBS 175.79]|uniref:Ariadne RING finger n=1 Tax=Aaosphaeria arxii CBS 175.79 TaxID=1450172 RepID=A0A6A5Y7Q2_9PLEO|nr:uncharacterized protein BU24DRAFT_469808 [Aaosphaeria arxii CBS 175.79]KAF2021037.1 hypothetical protein BU24DRAFT_469808 [Aaosphaeria arxii CBS 175.79]
MRPCKFFALGTCRNGNNCTYDHETTTSTQNHFGPQDQVNDDDFVRDLLGASVYFNEFGQILKVSFPTDYSLACITGLAPGVTPETIVDILRGLGFNVDVSCVRISKDTALSETKATVKVEDPSFAQELSTRTKNQGSTLSAVPVAIDTRRTNCRKVHISWHKATRSVWLNFGNGEIAARVGRKFNEGRYKCLDQLVKSSTRRSSQGRGYSHNPVAWTVTLSDVFGDATTKDVESAIISQHDKPRHVEMGSISYRASDGEVSVEVRSQLEEHGPLESFHLASSSKGKRVKATAWFQDEADARSACSLNNAPLDILRKGKLTVTPIQTAKVKVVTKVYFALKSRIDEESKTWKERHLAFHVYHDSAKRFTTLKIEGDNPKDVANTRKILDRIVSGAVLMDGENVVWSSALSSNGSTYENVKSIEKELNIALIRDKPKRQVRFYGSPEKFEQAVCRISDMLKDEPSMSYEVDLKPHQFAWAIHSGFKSIEQALGKNVAVFNVVLRRIAINGTQQQYETALSIMHDKRPLSTRPPSDAPSKPEGDCPICFCEAESPIQTSCKHTYCLECFEECCKSAASTSNHDFAIRCQGDEGTCPTVFPLRELKDHLSSSVFETVLECSFKGYIQRHPDAFHYCSTPDCGYIYRCTAPGSKPPPAYTCPNCFEPLCTSCHARHGDYTCAEYKDMQSGGYEALEKLKRELNIKDCPKCTTPMEKTEGCNHMTCGGCRAHICWVCMAVFETSGDCYGHMNRKHGGIGLGLEGFMD